MVVCEQCFTKNTLDSRFCKSCGAELNPEEVTKSKESNIKLLAEARKLLDGGRFDEAKLAAEEILSTDPADADAHALLGDVLEAQGDLAGALSAHEKAAELKPDEALEKIKVTHLRNQLAAPAEDDLRSRRRTAALAGAAAVVLVASIASGFAVWSANASAATPQTDGTQVATNAPVDLPAVPQRVRDEAVGAPQERIQQGPTPVTGPAAEPATVQGGAREARPLPDVNTGGLLPNPVPNGSFVNPSPPSVEPLRPADFAVNPTPQPQPLPRPPVTADPDPTPVRQPESEERNPGMISIVPSGAAGGAQSQPSGNQGSANEIETLLRVGNDHFIARNYDRAAQAFERAIARGAGGGTVHQNLGRTYQRLGQTQKAVAAYDRAIREYEAQLSSGRGDAGAIRQAIESSRAAIRLLAGG